MSDLLPVVVLCVALIIATLSQRIAGMGFGLVMGPTSALLYGPIAAVIIVSATAAIACGLIVPRVWRAIEWRRLAWLAIPAIALTIPGLLIARVVNADILRIAIGSIAIVGVVIAVVFTRSERRLDGPVTRVTTGSLAGFLNAAVGVGAPPIGVYQIVSRWDPRPFSATMQVFWVAVSSMTILQRQLLVPDGWPELPPLAWVAATGAIVAGTFIAEPIAKRVPPRAVWASIIVLTVLGGAAVIIAGGLGLAT